MRRLCRRTPLNKNSGMACIYAAPMSAHTPEEKQQNGIYICGAYAGAHPCVNDSFFAKTNIKPIKSL